MDEVLAQLFSPDSPAGVVTAFAVLAAIVVFYLMAIVSMNGGRRKPTRER
jgi:hypothetical protein